MTSTLYLRSDLSELRARARRRRVVRLQQLRVEVAEVFRLRRRAHVHQRVDYFRHRQVLQNVDDVKHLHDMDYSRSTYMSLDYQVLHSFHGEL